MRSARVILGLRHRNERGAERIAEVADRMAKLRQRMGELLPSNDVTAELAQDTQPARSVGAPSGNQNAVKEVDDDIADLPLMQAAKENKGSNRTFVSDTGRGDGNASYLIARLKRDHPEIAVRLEAGEFKSVRQAALVAGIVDATVSVPLNPLKAARRLRKHFQGERLAELIRARGILLPRPDRSPGLGPRRRLADPARQSIHPLRLAGFAGLAGPGLDSAGRLPIQSIAHKTIS